MGTCTQRHQPGQLMALLGLDRQASLQQDQLKISFQLALDTMKVLGHFKMAWVTSKDKLT